MPLRRWGAPDSQREIIMFDSASAIRAGKAVFLVVFIAAFQSSLSAQGTPGLFIKVHSETGQAIEGAEVRLERNGVASVQTVTNAEGQAKITGLVSGLYRIVAGLKGFEDASQF